MKLKLPILIITLLFALGCSRDDICSPETSKTPLLIITFLDFDNPTFRKEVPNFTLVNEALELALLEPQTLDSIAIPLDTSGDVTEFIFFKNATEEVPNADHITFTYQRQDEFINRACAFRTNFNNLEVSLQKPTPQSWIQQITILTDSINARNQNEAHITIFH